MPLSFTLDTACAITRSVRDAVLLHEVLAARRVAAARPAAARAAPGAAARAACSTAWTPPWRAPSNAAWHALRDGRCRDRRSRAAGRRRAGRQQRADRRGRGLGLASRPPRRRARPTTTRACWRASAAAAASARPTTSTGCRRGDAGSRRWKPRPRGIDAFICPTVPIVAPPLQPLLDDDEAFFATNALLLRNPSVVNYLDGCALSLPCQAAGRAAGRPDGLGAGAARRHRARRVAGHRARARRARALTRAHRRHRRRHRRRHECARTGCRRPRGHGLRAPRRRGQRDQLRQRRRDRAGLRHALGRAGHAVEGAAPPVRPPRAGALRRRQRAGASCRGSGAGGAPAARRSTRPTAVACTSWRATAASACTR